MGALINIDHDIDVVEAAERRIVNLFSKHKVVCFSTSGGKDSLVCSDVLIRTMQKYQIPFSRLFVVFFDEEAMFDDVIEVARQQRSRFLALGAKFYWFCLPIKHYNCCSLLYDDECSSAGNTARRTSGCAPCLRTPSETIHRSRLA